MENKKTAQDFPGPIWLPFRASLKVSFKKVICLWVRNDVTMSAGHPLVLSHVETGP